MGRLSNNVKANEREFQSQVYIWLSEFIKAGGTPFEMIGGEAGVKTGEGRGSTKFPDIQLWLNRGAGQGFCFWELKPPQVPVDNGELLDNALNKARSQKHKFFVTWNMSEAVIWEVPEGNQPVNAHHRLKNYPPLPAIFTANDLSDPSKIGILRSRANEILADLIQLHKEGHLNPIETDATFFVQQLKNAVTQIYPSVHKALQKKVAKDNHFRDGLEKWAKTQGIKDFGDEPFFESVSRQMVYRVTGKILFYLTLRRYHDAHLPEMVFTSDKVSQELRGFFSTARQVDYQSVFDEDLTDAIEYPAEAASVLTELVHHLNKHNFSTMHQDVVGEVFEKLIPPEERHLLGQYFTPENLVDLINAFCIQTPDAAVMDPTCGTGTFLIRAYDKKRDAGERDHHNLLSQIWGFDVAQFPSELAAINLYRLDLRGYDNFPHVLRRDFFEAHPGDSYEFPPPKLDDQNPTYKIRQKLPSFDAIVGNFPYIRQELIEKSVQGYKAKIDRVLQRHWLKAYPDGFNRKTHEPKLSGQADIYASLFFHAAAFLKEGGRMGIVTSNSWLDVGYGFELQKFFLNNFKVVAILESRCEPWFDDAAVNTVVTVLERCTDKKQRETHAAKFVKIKKKMADLIPWDMKLDSHRRWEGLYKLIRVIERSDDEADRTIGKIKVFENADFRVRTKSQRDLLEEVESAGRTVKWGQYLRAPDVYFEIMEKCGKDFVPLSRVAEIRRGFTTGINEFFYLDEEKAKHWRIEKEFLAPVIKSPKEFDRIEIDPAKLKTLVFLCSKTKAELRSEGKSGALKYIEWGETQRAGNVPWPDVPSVKNRKPGWWVLPDVELVRLFWTKTYDDTFLQGYSPMEVLADQRLYMIKAHKSINLELLAAVLNGTIFSLMIELNGRNNLGEGALDTTVEESQDYFFLPDPAKIRDAKGIVDAFRKIAKRKVGSIFDEAKLKDRQKLDGLILESLGLDPDKYLDEIYDGLCGLVKERIGLAGMRKTEKRAKVTRDTAKVKEQVSAKIIPDGLTKFPGGFLPGGIKSSDFRDVSIPKELLQLGNQMMMLFEVVAGDGFKFEANGAYEAKYLIHAQKPNQFLVKVPKNQMVAQKTVVSYEKYLKKVKEDLFQELFERTGEHALADRLAREILSENGARADIL